MAIATMQYKKFGKLDFKKLHPSGSLGAQLKTVEDIMIVGKKIPFVSHKMKMKRAINLLTEKKLGILIVRNAQNKTIGIITDAIFFFSTLLESSLKKSPDSIIFTSLFFLEAARKKQAQINS